MSEAHHHHSGQEFAENPSDQELFEELKREGPVWVARDNAESGARTINLYVDGQHKGSIKEAADQGYDAYLSAAHSDGMLQKLNGAALRLPEAQQLLLTTVQEAT